MAAVKIAENIYWGGGAVKDIEEILRKTGIQPAESISFQYMPDEEELKKCYEFGKDFAKRITTEITEIFILTRGRASKFSVCSMS